MEHSLQTVVVVMYSCRTRSLGITKTWLNMLIGTYGICSLLVRKIVRRSLPHVNLEPLFVVLANRWDEGLSGNVWWL